MIFELSLRKSKCKDNWWQFRVECILNKLTRTYKKKKKHTKDSSGKERKSKNGELMQQGVSGILRRSSHLNVLRMHKGFKFLHKSDILFLSLPLFTRCNVCTLKEKESQFCSLTSFLQKSVFGLPFLCFFPPEHSKYKKNEKYNTV